MSSDKQHYFRMVCPAFPAFNVYSRVARVTTALGPLSVATTVSQMDGWGVEVIDENNYRKLGPLAADGLPDHGILQSIRPADCVGLYGGLSSTIPRLLELAAFYKSKGCVVVAGGQHFVGDNIAAALRDGVDYIVIGEGEDTIRELLTAIPDADALAMVKGIAYVRGGEIVMTDPRPPITDFESLPFPDYDLLRYAKIACHPINWVRGCGMNCEFCTVKGRPRAATPERMLKQISMLLETRNARDFFIVDDLFGHKRSEALRFCRMLAEYQKAINTRLKLTVQIRLDRANDTELLQAMRDAGVQVICIGFESPIAEELDAMNKGIKPEDMVQKAVAFHKAGFLVHGMFIFGYPLAGNAPLELTVKQRIKRFRSFIRRAKLDTIQVLLPVPLPGTELTARLNEEGRTLPVEQVGWEYYDGNFPLFHPDSPLTPEDMLYALQKIMGGFYRFRYLFAVGGSILSFPKIIFFPFNLKSGWRYWYRSWRNNIKRFGGWLIIRHWNSHFNRKHFLQRFNEARAHHA